MNEKAVKTVKEANSNGKNVKEQIAKIRMELDVEDQNEQIAKPNVEKEQDVQVEKEQNVKRKESG